jgi:hypothetical protein
MSVSLNQLEKAHAALRRAIAVEDRVLLGSDTYSPPVALEVTAKARLFDAACGLLISQLKAQPIDE